jgi:hypothetical protein
MQLLKIETTTHGCVSMVHILPKNSKMECKITTFGILELWYEKGLRMQCLWNFMKYIPTMLEYLNSTCYFIIEMPLYIL